MKAFLVRAKEMNAGDKESGEFRPKKSQPGLHQLTVDFVAWSKEYNQWLKTNGKNYGLFEVARKPPK